MVRYGFLGFNFSFRLTFSDTPTRKVWYRSEIMIDEARRWPFQMVGLAFPISAILIMHQVDWSCCLCCQFFLILLGGALPLDVHLVQWIETSDKLTEVSEWLIAMSVILALMILCDAGIVCIAPGFCDSSHRLSTCLSGMQVMLVLITAFGVGFIAFVRVMELLHLAWPYSRAIRDAISRLRGLTLSFPAFVGTNLITTFRLAVGRTENRSLAYDCSGRTQVDWDLSLSAMDPLF